MLTKAQSKKLCECAEMIESLMDTLNGMRDGLDEKYQNMSEKQQEGEKGELLQACINGIDDALTDLETAQGTLENVASSVDE